MRAPSFILAAGAALLLGGCAGGPLFGSSKPAANADHPRAEAVLARDNAPVTVRDTVRDGLRDSVRDAGATLREGIRLYDSGDFNGAIAKLGAPEIQTANATTRITALKYTAFSYCVTQRPVPCRQAFDKALKIDARFDLAPGEQGHPMWGPVFDKARASR